MAGDSLAGSLGEVPAKDVAVIAKAASEEAAKWLKRNNVEAGAGTPAYAGTLLKISTSSDQRTRTGIFILIASGGTVYIEPLSSKVIASDTDALIKLYLQSDAPERRTTNAVWVDAGQMMTTRTSDTQTQTSSQDTQPAGCHTS